MSMMNNRRKKQLQNIFVHCFFVCLIYFCRFLFCAIISDFRINCPTKSSVGVKSTNTMDVFEIKKYKLNKTRRRRRRRERDKDKTTK